MRIDSHAHGMPGGPSGDPGDCLAQCHAAGIDAVVLIGDPVSVLVAKAKLRSFVIPVPVIDMDVAAPDDVRRLFDQGARGIKFIAPQRPYGDERYHPLYETVKERDEVAVFHTGYLMHDAAYSPRWRVKLEDMRTCHMDTIERWVPHLRILMSHFGNPYWDSHNAKLGFWSRL